MILGSRIFQGLLAKGNFRLFLRVALVEGIRKRLDGKGNFIVAYGENIDVALAIEECETACTDPSVFEGKRIFIIKGLEDADRFIKLIDDLTCIQR